MSPTLLSYVKDFMYEIFLSTHGSVVSKDQYDNDIPMQDMSCAPDTWETLETKKYVDEYIYVHPISEDKNFTDVLFTSSLYVNEIVKDEILAKAPPSDELFTSSVNRTSDKISTKAPLSDELFTSSVNRTSDKISAKVLSSNILFTYKRLVNKTSEDTTSAEIFINKLCYKYKHLNDKFLIIKYDFDTLLKYFSMSHDPG